MQRIAILASGAGTNARRLITHFRGHPEAEVVLVGCDQPSAGVVQLAWEAGVATYLFNGAQLRDGALLGVLQEQQVDMVVLAGFMRLIPVEMVQAYRGRMVNIHPALLPAHGGKGMFGDHVHRAVLAAAEKESGITIHLVNERFDEGEHLLQVRCPVLPEDTPATLAQRIHALEHEHYPQAVEMLLRRVRGAG